MAATVTSNLVLINAADNNTGWTSDGGGLTAYSGFQREGTAVLGEQASNGAVNTYYTFTAADLSNSTIFGPWLRSGNPTLQSTGGFRIIVGDGTNRAAYYVGGSDNYGFFVLGYSMFRLDVAQKSNFSNLTLAGGGDGSLTTTAITDVGGGWNYGSKAVGNSDNVFEDVVRYINNGVPALVIGGGGAVGGSPGPATWADVVEQDEDINNAWGIIRQVVVGAKAYELIFGVDIGNNASPGEDSYFIDSDFQLFINGTFMTEGNMDVSFLATPTATNVFQINNFVIVNTETPSTWDFSTPDSNTMRMTNGQFVDMGDFFFPPFASNREASDCTFVGCEQVNPNTMLFTNNSFIGTTSTQGALNWPTDDSNISDLDFIAGAGAGSPLGGSPAAEHAIYLGPELLTGSPVGIGSPGEGRAELNFTRISFTGYGKDETEGAAVWNNTGGEVTINIINGDTPTVLNSDGSVTIINNAVTVSVDVEDVDGNPIRNARVGVFPENDSTPGSEILLAYTDGNGNASTSYNFTGDLDIIVRVRKSSSIESPPGRFVPAIVGGTITTAGFSVLVRLIEDTNVI